jgi:formylglycine-generating enzyme required for sulfatase activity
MKRIIAIALTLLMVTVEAHAADAQAGGGPVEGMVFVKGGCYLMGDVFGDGYKDERPVHKVCVDDFYMDKTEVTQMAYREATGENPAYYRGDERPVEKVRLRDAYEYCRKAGKRLPTEAEWEYAARSGGGKERYAGTDDNIDDYAWHKSNSGGKTHPVGKKNPNGLGLYDMSGNVSEWTADRYGRDYYGKSPRKNPKGPAGGSTVVIRGGSKDSRPRVLRTTYRLREFPYHRYGFLGFRCASTP